MEHRHAHGPNDAPGPGRLSRTPRRVVDRLLSSRRPRSVPNQEKCDELRAGGAGVATLREAEVQIPRGAGRLYACRPRRGTTWRPGAGRLATAGREREAKGEDGEGVAHGRDYTPIIMPLPMSTFR